MIKVHEKVQYVCQDKEYAEYGTNGAVAISSEILPNLNLLEHVSQTDNR